MDWEGDGLTDRVLAWLESAGAGRYVGERRLDPFATSMRDFDDVSAHLVQVRDGIALDHSDPKQRMTDLRSAGLVGGVLGDAHLTQLGLGTLEAWQNFGVATDSKSDELARILLLLITAQALEEPQYLGYLDYWAELRAAFPPLKLIDSWDTLYILNYLDFEIDGFSPGVAYRDLPIPFDDIEYDLDDFVNDIDASDLASLGADRVAERIKGKIPRGRARATFSIALELISEKSLTPHLLLEAFGYPKKPRSWVAYNYDQISQIDDILESYGLRSKPGRGVDRLEEGSTPEERAPYILPSEINFAEALRDAPKPPKRAPTGKGTGPKKIDYKKRQERNDFVGDLGERFALGYERWRLRDHAELQEKVIRVSSDDDTLGYDIQSWEVDGAQRLVEVKSTLGPLETRFFLSSNELECAGNNPASYLILRVGNLKGRAGCCEVRFPFDELEIEPVVYAATFKSE